ncbi:MAG: CPBP family intramembrane metalloprotease [Actinomycetota bacterium]|nr:CPBP family intramembrane metalloprotease [Actinomycetota bacterium]
MRDNGSRATTTAIPLSAPASATAESLKRLASVYLAGIVVAEISVAFFDLTAGVLLHALLVLMLLNHYLFARVSLRADPGSEGRRGEPADVLLVLPLVSLLRIVSVTVVLEEVPEIYQYAVAGTPVLLSAVAASRSVRGASIARRLRSWSWRTQLPIAVSGVPLGYLGFVLARPESAFAHVTPANALLGAAILVVFTGFAEEIVFRGLLQDALTAVFGAGGLLASSALFAAAYLGAGPAGYVVFAACLGLAFAWLVRRTGSLLGVSIAHGLLNVGLILVWPSVIG